MKLLLLRLSSDMENGMHHPLNLTAPITLGYCCSLLKKLGYDVTLVDCMVENYTLNSLTHSILESDYGVVVMYITPSTLDIAKKIAVKLKTRKKIFIVAIGPYVTTLPKNFIYPKSPFDVGIVGEIEFTLKELADNLSNNKKTLLKIPGIAYLKQGRVIFTKPSELINLTKLPFPNHEFFLDKCYKLFYPTSPFMKNKWGFIMSSRGCPYSCIFCSELSRVSYGEKFRSMPINVVIREIEFLISKGVNIIQFIDDIFTYDCKRVEKLCDEIINRGIKFRWYAQSRVDHITPKLIKKMRKAGCIGLSFGIESGSDKILRLLNKGITVKQINSALKLCRESGIKIVLFMMVGNPKETLGDIKQSFNLCIKNKPDMIQVTYFIPHPGSNIYKKKKISKFDYCSTYSHYDNSIITNFSKIPKSELKRLQKKFYIRYYSNPLVFIKLFWGLLPEVFFNFGQEMKFFKKTIMYLFK